MVNSILNRISVCLAIGVALFIMGARAMQAQEKIPLTFISDMMNPTAYSVDHYVNHYALFKGKVQAEGVKLNLKPFWIWDATRLMVAGEGDVGHMTLNSYLMAKDRAAPLVMISVAQIVVPETGKASNMVFVRTGSGLRTPKDFEGKKVGLPGLVSASAIYQRAIFQHKYGVDTGKITWVDKGTPELYALLKRGDIDAANLFGGIADKAMVDPALQNLYWTPNVWKEMTGMPFITVILAAKNSVLEKYPGALRNLLTALKLSKKYGEENKKEILAEAVKEFGSVEEPGTIFQPYELTEQYKEAAKLFMKYALEQKVIRKEIDPSALFAELK